MTTLATHPDTIRPDHAGGRFVPTAPFALESEATAQKMAGVILACSRDGRPTLLADFREAPETRDLTADDIARHIGRASRIADKVVIRQDAIAEADVTPPPRTDDELLTIAVTLACELDGLAAITCHLLQNGFEKQTLARLWPRFTIKLSAAQVGRPFPSDEELAEAAA